MELLRHTNIDFMKYRRFWILVSLALLVLAILSVFVIEGVNLGIDFAGGTQMNLRFRERPPVDDLRTLLEQQGMREAQIQRFGDEKNNEVIVKTTVAKGSEEGNRERIVRALNQRFNQGQTGKLDLNNTGADALAGLLAQADPDGVAGRGPEEARRHYTAIAEALLAERRKDGIFTSWNEIANAPGMSPRLVEALKARASLGDFSVVGVENVGPQIGKELRRQGFLAVLMSLLGMLAYIGFRFELRFGVGAVMATLHDVLVTLGLFTLLRFEFNLTTIAAFLTLVGYSVNDTVVIFDRMRENMRKSRRKPMLEIMNESINETLSRTIMTSGLTFLTVVALLVLGGDVLRGFAFVMTVGIIVGTYSSIYIASPFALLWEHFFGAEAKARKKVKGQPVPAAATAGAVRPAPAARKPPASKPPASKTAAGGPKPAVGDEEAEPVAAAPRPRPRPRPTSSSSSRRRKA